MSASKKDKADKADKADNNEDKNNKNRKRDAPDTPDEVDPAGLRLVEQLKQRWAQLVAEGLVGDEEDDEDFDPEGEEEVEDFPFPGEEDEGEDGDDDDLAEGEQPAAANEDEEDDDEDADPTVKEFERELKAIEDRTGKQFVVLESWKPPGEEDQNGSENEEEGKERPKPTIEELRKLGKVLVPQAVIDNNKRVVRTLDKACGGLFMLWTSHSYTMHEVFNKELKKVKQLATDKTKIVDAFSLLFGTTLVMQRVDHWYIDTEGAEPVEELMGSLYKLWKALLVHTDEELQMEGENGRHHLINFLKKFGNEVKSAGEYDFEWF